MSNKETIEQTETRSKVPQFKKEDPHGWRQEFTGYMRRHNMAHLALTLNKPTGQDNLATWEKKNSMCISYLQEAVNQPENRGPKSIVFAHENRNKTAKELCDILTTKYHVKDPRAIHAAQESFHGLRLLDGEKATSFITRIEEGREVLRRLGKTLDEEIDLVGRLITGMEKDTRYAALSNALKLQTQLTWDGACKAVEAEDRMHPDPATVPEAAKIAITQSGKPTQPIGNCQLCGKDNHIAKTCHFRYKRDGDNQGSGQGGKNKQSGGQKEITCFYCKKKGHKSFDCRKKKRDGEQGKKGKGKGDKPAEKSTTGHKRKGGWDDNDSEEFSGMMQQSGKRSNTQA